MLGSDGMETKRCGGGMPMQHDRKKEQFLKFLTAGLLKHSSEDTDQQLGDRSQYIGLSDIGKGMECLRSAVADKAGVKAQIDYEDVFRLPSKELETVLGKQIVLQRGHWQEYGIQKAIEASGVHQIPQLEISIEYKGVPIKAHLDFTLVWSEPKPAIRIVELKSNQRIPNHLYTSYETQVYGQVGLLYQCWNKPCFNVTQGQTVAPINKVTFPEIVNHCFGIQLSDTPEDVDIEAWVLSISLNQVKPFGPYIPNDSALKTCLKMAERIWNEKSNVISGIKSLDDMEYAQGFHPLCDFCQVNKDCPKFKGLDILKSDASFDRQMEQLSELKIKEIAIKEKRTVLEDRIKGMYHRYAGANAPWLNGNQYRFRVSQFPGRKSLDQELLQQKLAGQMPDTTSVRRIMEQCKVTGKPFERLHISKINN